MALISVVTAKIPPPEDFLCNVAATGVSLFAREHAAELSLRSDCFVIYTTLIAPIEDAQRG